MKIENKTISPQRSIDKSKITYFIVCLIGFTQGVVELSHLAINYLFKDEFLLDPYEMSVVLGIISIPWIIKPLWGFISDSFPFMGYRRKTYLVFLSLFEMILWVILTFWSHNIWITSCLLFSVEFCIAFCNVIGEAILVEISRDINNLNDGIEKEKEDQQQSIASNNVSLFFGIKYFGIFLTAYLSGFLLEYIDKRQIFLITASFPLTLCLCSFFLPEKRFSNLEDDKSEISISNEEVIINEENEILNKKTNEELIEKSNDIQTAKVHAPNCDCKNCFRLWNFLRKKEILKPIIFILVFTSIPSIASPMFYFYTNVLNFTPEFMGQLRVISAVASAFAVLLYNCFLKLVKFKNIFFWTAILSIISQLFLLILITRYNIKLGIHDKVFSICDNLFIHMMGELNLIPVLVFACRICPKNVEGTMYALIMSTLNLGSLISEQTGALFIYLLEISSTNFTYLWLLIVIESAFIVLLLPFLFCLKINEAQMIAKGENPDRKNYESDNEKSNNKSFENIQNKTKDENSIKKLDKKI